MVIQSLVIGGHGFVSHRTAANIHGLDPQFRGITELTVKKGAHKEHPGVFIHESNQIHLADVTMVNNLPVSGVERSIMDVAAVVKETWKVLALIDSARIAGKTDLKKLHACLMRHARRGRNGTVHFRESLRRIRADEPPAIGPFSREVAEALYAAGLRYPSLETSINGLGGEFIAQVDLYWPERGLVLFLDGFTYHGARRDQTNRDRVQRERLRATGLTVLEITWDRWHHDPGDVLTSVHRTYWRLSPPFVA